MKAKYVFRLAGVSALLSAATLATSVTAASATATQVPIDSSNPLFIPIGVPPVGVPGVTFVNCSTTIEGAYAALEFVDGNGHLYGPTNHPLTNGANVEGDAYWLGFAGDPTVQGSNPPLVYSYFGQAHAWFGQNNYPSPPGGPAPGHNAEVTAQTIMFHGTGAGGSLDVQASFGQTQSASGHQSGWGHLKVTCS